VLARELAGQVEVERVDVSTEAGQGLAGRFSIFSVPAALLLGEDSLPVRDWRDKLPTAEDVLEEVADHA